MKSDAKILVVDDEPLLREIAADWLGSEGYQVETARDGMEALGMLEAGHFDAVVTDIRMPRMDGVTLLKKLKESGRLTPSVVFVSGFADIDRREAYDLGAEGLISKPFSDDELLSVVRRMLTPREELWRSTAAPANSALLGSEFCTAAAARESGRLAFGRGGFCLKTNEARGEGPVRFDLHFAEESCHVQGHGAIRWLRPAETAVGVEINSLTDECRVKGIQLTVQSGAHSYIPATPRG